MSETLKLRRLEHLVLLAEELNFARAAERAFLSQSAFSRSVQALEDSLSLRLLDRGLRHIRLTPAGERVVSRARRLLASSSDLRRELELLRRGDLGDVAAGAGPFAALAIFPEALSRLRSVHHKVNVKLTVDNWRALLCLLGAEKLDFFISDVQELPPSEHLTVLPIGALKLSLYCREGHPLLDRGLLDLADLAHAQFATVSLPVAVRRALSAMLAPHLGAPLPVVFESESAAVTREFVLRTDVVLLACAEALQLELETGRIRELPVRQLQELADGTPLRMEIGVVRWKDRTLAPASELLLAHALEVANRCLVRPPNAEPSRSRTNTEDALRNFQH